MPLNKLSVKSTWLITVSNGLNTNDLQGTYKPHCAKITFIPIARNKLLLPAEFKPYNSMPFFSFVNEISFGIYLVLRRSMIGCLNCSA